MSSKMARKPKANNAATKPGATVHYGNSGAKPQASVLHEAGAALASTAFPADHEPMPGGDQAAELSNRLVAEVAEGGSDVHALCDAYHLKREELGRLTGFSLRALADWASGDLPSQPAKRRLHEVRRLLDALSEIVQRERIPHWLHQRNPAFGNLTPLQVIEVGEMDRLWAMVHDLGAGQLE